MRDKGNHHRLLKQRIDEVLYYIWDPVGVSDTPETRDEYSSYVDSILLAALGGHPKKGIAAQLTSIAVDHMGLDPRKDHDEKVAGIILGWARFLKPVACQVCGNFTISEHGSFDICPVCCWEDDGLYDDPNEVWDGPNENLSLTQARKNYIEFGAANKRLLKYVRKPEKPELPENN